LSQYRMANTYLHSASRRALTAREESAGLYVRQNFGNSNQ
jgi:hypothetical protein